MQSKRKLLLVGWDAADWKVIRPLMDQGKMPNIARLVERGVMGNITTLKPCLSPMLWNSIATGKYPDKHGILGFSAPNVEGQVQPVMSTARKVKAIWNILSQNGFRTNVVGWFAGHPAEPINGICVSPFFHSADKSPKRAWPVAPDSVHPAELAEELASLRIHPRELGRDEILPFITKAVKVDQSKDKRIGAMMKNLAELLTNHNVATWILQNREWDFVAVYHTWIDHLCHMFMPFHPPRMPEVPEDQFEIYKDVINAGYIYQDMLLGTQLRLAGPDATVLLLSDHGYHSDHLRPRWIPKEGAGPAVCHRDQGIFVLAGPGIKKDELIFGATLLDVAPTVLTLLGLPVGEDMDGRVLTQVFETVPQIQSIPSWEQVPGEAGMHPPDRMIDPREAYAVLQQFIALGYVEPPGEDKAKAAKRTATELDYNLARVYLYSNRVDQAIPILERLAEEDPQRRYLLNLAAAYLETGRLDEGSAMLDRVPRNEIDSEWDYLKGCILAAQRRDEEAVEVLVKSLDQDHVRPDLLVLTARACIRIGKHDSAERAVALAIRFDPDYAPAYAALARLRLNQQKNEEAAEAALAAVARQHFTPAAHFYLGTALARLGDWKRARFALDTALLQLPTMKPAHRLAAFAHMQPGGDPSRALYHQKALHQLRRKPA